MSFDRQKLQEAVSKLATLQLFVGTSSWKYPGWEGLLYDKARYVYRGRYSKARFEEHCLSEYAEVFRTVCVDAAHYQFPTADSLEQLRAQIPGDFYVTLKVTDEITLKRFPNLPRFGRKAGQINPAYLNQELFQRAFLRPCESLQRNIGALIFQFPRFSSDDFKRGRDFVEQLNLFLADLPKGWRYGVEIRNPAFLQPEYFSVLAAHGVSHVFNSWEAMPAIGEQLEQEASWTTPDFCCARFLLQPGRRYEDAVKLFSPYDRVREVYPEGRAAAARLLRHAKARKTTAFVYVNNRFEGNALETLIAMMAEAAL